MVMGDEKEIISPIALQLLNLQNTECKAVKQVLDVLSLNAEDHWAPIRFTTHRQHASDLVGFLFVLWPTIFDAWNFCSFISRTIMSFTIML